MIEKLKKATGHGREATRLLQMAKALHAAQENVSTDAATIIEAVIKLNEQAIREMEECIRLRKEFIAGRKKDRRR